MRKRDMLVGAAAAGLAGFVAPRVAAQRRAPEPRTTRAKQTNLLFITVDDMDVSIPGFMGNPAGLTPHLDALAARSHRFVNNRTVAPICMPSRQAFMTGLVPHRSGGTGFIPVRDGTPTLTTLLQKAGYYAAAIHKVDHMQPYGCFPWDYIQQAKDRHILIHAMGVRVAIEEARALGRPFVIQCNIDDPHRPFYGSDAAAKMDHDQQGPYAVAQPVRPEDVTVSPNLDDLPDVRRELAQYWTSAKRMDAAIGQILKMLDEMQAGDNTAIVFCADHGMPFPFSKATCYDHGTRVPVLIGWPGMGEARAFDTLTTSVDILPTLLELLDVAAPEKLDGRSWLPLIRGEPFTAPDYQFTYVNEVSSGMAYPARAIQDGRYSLIFQPWADGKLAMRLESMQGLTWPAMEAAAKTDPAIAARNRQYVYGLPLAFYDLKTDPGQRRNLIDVRRHAGRIARMRDALIAEMERTSDPQLANLRAVLAGRPATVTQDPARYRLRGAE